MKRTLELLTVDQLVDRFAEIGVAQDEALLYDEHKRFNRLFSEMNEVDQELCRRGLDARLALCRLYGHPNVQVRVKAGIRTLAVGARCCEELTRRNKSIEMAASSDGCGHDPSWARRRGIQAGLRTS